MKFTIALVVLGLVSLGPSAPNNFCICPKLDDRNVAELKKSSDVIVIGKFIRQIPLGNYDRGINTNGYFKIDSVLKGPAQLKHIVINQFPSGNCRELFDEKTEYVVTGKHITEFKHLDYPDNQSPPATTIRDTVMECYSLDQNTLGKWNTIANENYVVFTNQCLTFNLNSKSAAKILEY